jgi:hypothetical protein
MTTDYLDLAQVEKLLAPIDPRRVRRLKPNNFLHMEAYDVRAAMIRVFGFARWSAETTAMEVAYERSENGRHWCAYRAQVRLSVSAPDGTPLATYTEWAIGESSNQPSQGDCHDMAIKTAESQAFKRAAVNLGDCFGLGLYSGSTDRVVGRTLVMPDGSSVSAPDDVDEEVRQVVSENPEEREPAPDPREHNVEPEPADKSAQVDAFVALVEQGPPEGTALVRWHAKLLARATAERLLNEEAPGGVTVKTFIDLARDSRRAS